MTTTRRFLTAEWRNLVMLNYEIDPEVLAPHLPAGCEIDFWDNRTFVSVVGFQFFETKVLGLAIPFHRNFEEVNLRFYVRRKAEDGWRRGVVFVKELVPRWAIAFVARRLYGENYQALPMRHEVGTPTASNEATVGYEWRRGGVWEGVSAIISGHPISPADDSEESFITEHYWGYAAQRDRTTVEYRVEHPRWQVWRANSALLECDIATLYGREFTAPLASAPSTAFVADGSPTVVRKGRPLG